MTVLADALISEPSKSPMACEPRQISQCSTEYQSECGSPSDSESWDGKLGRSPPPLLAARHVPTLMACGPLTRLAIRVVQPTIYFGCMALTRMVLGVRSFFAVFLRGGLTRAELHRPNALVSWKMLREAEDPVAVARSRLPVPPPLPTPPEEGLQIAFGPCANLMLYTGGVAACLQRCPNYEEVFPHLRFYGISCGAFVASTMAANQSMLEFLPMMLQWTEKFQGRLWGLIGAYSASISAIVRGMFSKPGAFETARHRLGIPVTAFLPGPQKVVVNRFASAEDLMTTLLGSCYISVAFETPMWSKSLGPVWDGAIFEFAAQGDIVVSPYANSLPDIVPSRPYPAHFSFFPPNEDDAVRVFEDGYMDCLRWLEAGAPSRSLERQAAFGHQEGGMGPMLKEARTFIRRILWDASLEGVSS